MPTQAQVGVAGATRPVARDRRPGAFRLALPAGLFVSALMAFLGVRNPLPWGLVIGFFVYLKAVRSDRVLVWLRRFHRAEPGLLPFGTVLQRACSGLCVPMTLQDSSFKTSYAVSGIGLLPFYPMIALFFFPPILVFLVTQGVLGELGGGFAAVASFLFSIVLLWRLFTRLGYRTLDAKKAMATLDRLVNAIRRRKGQGAGVLVLKCEDQSWQGVVDLALRKADLALLDVTEPSPSVLWELRQACQTMPTKSVILACRSESDQPQQLPQNVAEMVREAVGSDVAARLRVFYYPAKNPPVGPGRQRTYKKTAEALREALKDAVASKLFPLQRETQTLTALWRDYALLLVSLICATYIFFAAVFGPYNLRNAIEAVMGSAVLGLLISLPVLAWLWWRRGR
jgi:hypothetical protein